MRLCFFCLHYFFYVLYVLSTHHTEHTKCARAVLESVIVIIHCLSLIFTRIALKEMKTDVFLLIFIVVSNDTMLQRGRLCASFHNVFILHIFYVFERVTVSFCFLIRRFQCKYYCTNSQTINSQSFFFNWGDALQSLSHFRFAMLMSKCAQHSRAMKPAQKYVSLGSAVLLSFYRPYYYDPGHEYGQWEIRRATLLIQPIQY